MRIQSKMKRQTWIVLPAYNEAGGIGCLIELICEMMVEFSMDYKIVVVDDGSKDNSVEIVKSKAVYYPITLLQHEVNQGLGPTIRDGLFYAANAAADHDVIITMDADETHNPGLILRMVRMIYEGHDIIIASRYQSGSQTRGVPFHRRVLSSGASWLFRIIFPISGVKDYTCGYRAYNAGVIKKAITQFGQAFIDQDGFQCMVDILLKLRKMDVVFGEVPFILRYDLKRGLSKMNIGRTIINTFMLMLKRRFE